MTGRSKKESSGRVPVWSKATPFLRVALLLSFAVAVYRSVSAEQLYSALSTGRPWLALLALVSVNIAWFLMSVRLMVVLRAYRICISLLEVYKVTICSMYYLICLPTSVGYEAAKFVKIRGLGTEASKSELAAAIILDRSSGIVGLLVICTAIFFYHDSATAFLNERLLLAVVGVVCIGCIVIYTGRIWLRLHVPVADSLMVGLRNWRCLAVAASLSLLSHLGSLGSIYFLNLDFETGLSFADVALVFSASMLAQFIPLSIVGAGPGELVAVFLYRQIGADMSRAALVVFAFYLFRVVCGCVGGIMEHMVSQRTSGEI